MKKGLIVLNLGTPRDPSVEEVRAYLKEFLMDPFVLDIPTPLRWLLVNGIIAPFRAPKSAHAYQSIWTPEGSPLLVYTKRFLKKLKSKINKEWVVEAGMTYGTPSFQEALQKVLNAKVDEIYVVPLFPQWAMAAGGAAIYGFRKVLKKNGYKGPVKFLRDYHQSPSYISAIATQIRESVSNKHVHGSPKPHYLLSYHSLPERQILKEKGGPTCYRAQCYRTSELLADELGWKEGIDYTISFQSRLGRAKWIQPYTADTLRNLAKQGVEHLMVLCPGFSVDCLETLEEINMGGREIFLSNGGKSFNMIPCLNDSDIWVDKFIAMINEPDLPWIS